MPGTLSTTVYAQLNGIDKRAPKEGSATANINVSASANFRTGTGVGNADLLFSDNRTVAAGATDTLSLSGALADAFGGPLAMAKVKAILVKPSSKNANKITLSGPAGHGFAGPFGASGVVDVAAGGVLFFFDPAGGWAVVAGTGDQIAVTNAGAAPASYEIAILGASA